MEIYDYVENDCKSEDVVVPGYVKMMINRWTTLESKDDAFKTPTTHIVRSNTRQTKHSGRTSFRSCSPSHNLEVVTNGNRHSFYTINGTSDNIQHGSNKIQAVKSAKILQHNGSSKFNNFVQPWSKVQPIESGSRFLQNGSDSYGSNKFVNSFTQSFTQNSKLHLPNSINTKHLNLISKDLNGSATNPESNGSLHSAKKLSKSAKENVLKDKIFINLASIKFAPTDNNYMIINNILATNGFDSYPRKSNVLVYEDRDNILRENMTSVHHNTPEPFSMQNMVIMEELVPEKQDIVKDTTDKNDIVIIEKTTSDNKNGQYYLHIMNLTEDSLKSKCKEYENFEGNTSEEVSGRIRSLIGNTQLLITKKFAQFKKLCITNLQNNANEPSVTDEDLAGFWDLVLIQIQSIEDSFHEVDKIRANGWKDIVNIHSNTNSSPKKLLIRSTSNTKTENTPPSKSDSENADKSEERKKLSEEKQKLRRAIMQGRNQRKHSGNEDAEIQIFTK